MVRFQALPTGGRLSLAAQASGSARSALLAARVAAHSQGQATVCPAASLQGKCDSP